MRIVTNCVGQHLVMGRVPLGHRASLTRWGWGFAAAVGRRPGGNFFTEDNALAAQTARALGIPFGS